MAFLVTLVAATASVAQTADTGHSAVVVMYHRFGESQFPTTSIRLDQFEQHIALLEQEGARVLPLRQIVDRLAAGESLPDRAVAITVDDAYRSVKTHAWPRLKAAGLPLTMFVATDGVDAGGGDLLTWDEIRALAADGVDIGHHGAAHAHLVGLSPADVVRDLDRASARFEAELGKVPDLFAYPYGEVSLAVREAVRAYGFRAAFGQQSGPVHAGSDFHNLPRFALNERYGDADRFGLAIATLPIPARDVTPQELLLDDAHNPPRYGFTLAGRVGNIDLLKCYASHIGEVAVDRLGDNRIEVRFDTPFPPGRGRINCTVPAPGGGWRWIGAQFTID
jgi:peptidoglycan/xylan/chitin deacetylase (PgdA/CDA1 family)